MGQRLFALWLLVRDALRSSWFSSSLDLQNLAWTEAFDAMHEYLSQRYAFGEWKAIDWDALYDEFAPRIAAAEANNEPSAYYLALREYAFSIPDGHIELNVNPDNCAFVKQLKVEAVGGGYGLALLELDDGRVINYILSKSSPAARAGIQKGAEILTWNGQPTCEALDQVSIWWAMFPHATLEGQRLEKWRFLVRAPVGNRVEITYKNPTATKPRTVRLSAVSDHFQSLYCTQILNEQLDPSEPSVEGKILASGIGYLKIAAISDELGSASSISDIKKWVKKFIDQKVPGVMIDVRGNIGGQDDMVPDIVSFFFKTPDFTQKQALHYEQAAFYNIKRKKFEIEAGSRLVIKPNKLHYDGPVVALIDKGTISSGEGIPLAIQRLPQGTVIGTHGTYGSFGLTGGQIKLPSGYTLDFPTGQSLDAKQRIQLDSDHTLQGGILPDIRVPLTEENARASYIQGRDVVLEFAEKFLQERSLADARSLKNGIKRQLDEPLAR